jgi:hypothetical protein
MTNGSAAQQPNLFNLQGEGVTVSYSTTSIAGVPQFTYRDTTFDVSRSGDAIVRETTGIGTLVTIELENIADLRRVTFTLVLPEINLGPNNQAVVLHTLGVRTTNHTTIGGPDLIIGPLQTYETVALCGTAQFVTF